MDAVILKLNERSDMNKKFIINTIAVLAIFFPFVSHATYIKISIAPTFKSVRKTNVFVVTYPSRIMCSGYGIFSGYISIHPMEPQITYNNTVSKTPLIVDAEDWCDHYAGSHFLLNYKVMYKRTDSNLADVYTEGTIGCENVIDASHWNCGDLDDEKKLITISSKGDSRANGGNIIINMKAI